MNKDELFQTPYNFLGLPEELADPARARGWLLPIPYESTTSYGAGTRDGPAAILAASRQVELYDHEFGWEPAMDYGIHTMLPLNLVHRSPEAMVQSVEEAVAELFSGPQRPEVLGVLGGEHTHFGRCRARPGAGSSPEIAGRGPGGCACRPEGGVRGLPVQPCLRGQKDPGRLPDFSDRHPQPLERRGRLPARLPNVSRTVFTEEANEPEGRFLKDLAQFVRNKQVFFTIDLDGLDPSIMPAVGTPEPGGISWERMLEIARTVCENAAGVPVFDVVELAPIPGFRAPDFLAAKLVYKLFSYTLMQKQKRDSKRRSRNG